MSEHSLWLTLRRCTDGLQQLRLQRIEDRFTAGVPDVAYCFRGSAGWIELKHLPAWPASRDTPVRLPKLTIEQVAFAEAWERAGGKSWVLLQVGREYLLLPACIVRALHERRLTRTHVCRLAVAWGSGKLPIKDILVALIQKRNKIT